jgi:hypothetical protein
LEQQFFTGGQSLPAAGAPTDGQFQPVVGGSHTAEPDGADERHQHIKIFQVRQQQRGHHDGGNDQHPAHGGGALLGGIVGVDVGLVGVTDLLPAQPFESPRAQQNADGKADHHRGGGLKFSGDETRAETSGDGFPASH